MHSAPTPVEPQSPSFACGVPWYGAVVWYVVPQPLIHVMTRHSLPCAEHSSWHFRRFSDVLWPSPIWLL